ncbi:two-component sensor histidine kinase [Nocardiopsis kunsanensis]|uniref:histidine kinase n=1 Tax=Nocardiopsis kunsanensis TaxID=141693 RepID=A0A919CJ59_9ACTN|nr:histidine kinase [Nocardiopsis kunsanensis]GHD27582.1 two-component sensor histidine kinase [Nocardiopsis kunsanensis]
MAARRFQSRRSDRVPGRPDETLNDVAIAVVAATALLIAEVVFAHRNDVSLQIHSTGLLVAGAASIMFLSRRPLVTAVVVGLCLPLYYLTGSTDAWPAWLLLFVAVMRLAATGRRAAPVVTVLTAVVVFGVGESLAFEPWRTIAVLGWMIAIIAAAEISRGRALYLRATEERAAEAERTREEEARRRAGEERLHIARELHDVITHNISLINVQAASAVHRREPEQALQALETIKDTSKDTLRELRATLGVLRQVDEGPAGAPEAPAPGVSRLPELVHRTREAGLDVDFTVDGADAAGTDGPGASGAVEMSLPSAVDRAVYRTVQESLTNVRRHSDSARAAVAIDRSHGQIVVSVVDEGTGHAGPHREGNGLRGMRERAAALGGRFEAGPVPGGGFQVRAAFPVD